MAFSSGFLKHRITIQNRKAAVSSKFGLDSTGPEFEDTACIWASVDWQKGKAGMREGALDCYGVVLVRARWTNKINERSRIVYGGKTYQILPETFHADKQENTIQFMAQLVTNDNTPTPTPSNSELGSCQAGDI